LIKAWEGIPRDWTSLKEKDARCSLIAAFKNRFGAVRPEKGNVRGRPKGLGSVSAHEKRGVDDMIDVFIPSSNKSKVKNIK
jgi:hypothetical protein